MPEKTPSLKDTLNKINTINKGEATKGEQSNNDSKSVDNKVNVEPLSQAKLKEQYDIYIAKLKDKQARLYSTLKNKSPKILSDTAISLDFQNKAILDEFVSRIRPGMLSFLREVLNNPYIEIKEILAELDNIERPTLVSDNERLKNMSEKNPSLLKLKNKFNLDFD